MPSSALLIFRGVSAFPLVAFAYYVEYIVCDFINVYTFSH